MDLTTLAVLVDVLSKLVIMIGGVWAVFRLFQYRELKQRIQLDLDANLFRLESPENVSSRTWDRRGDQQTTRVQPHTHAIELVLKFTNKGFTRMRLFNIQVGINTMRAQDQAQFDEEDGHLHLTRIHTSGNIVPLFRVKDLPVEKTSFYYIEPGIEQTITYLALITEPRELVQIYAKFSLEQERIFPKKDVGPTGMYPHTAARTYAIAKDGSLSK